MKKRVTTQILECLQQPMRARQISETIGVPLVQLRFSLRTLMDRNVVHAVPSHDRTVLYVPGARPLSATERAVAFDALKALDAMRVVLVEIGGFREMPSAKKRNDDDSSAA